MESVQSRTVTKSHMVLCHASIGNYEVGWTWKVEEWCINFLFRPTLSHFVGGRDNTAGGWGEADGVCFLFWTVWAYTN